MTGEKVKPLLINNRLSSFYHVFQFSLKGASSSFSLPQGAEYLV